MIQSFPTGLQETKPSSKTLLATLTSGPFLSMTAKSELVQPKPTSSGYDTHFYVVKILFIPTAQLLDLCFLRHFRIDSLAARRERQKCLFLKRSFPSALAANRCRIVSAYMLLPGLPKRPLSFC